MSQLYSTSFKPESYIQQFFPTLDNEPEIQWHLDEAHKIFSGRGILGEGAGQGVARSLLEVGTGPTPFNTGSAGGWASTVLWADYLPVNRRFARAWLQQEGATPAFATFFDHVAGREGAGTGDHVADRLREKVAGWFLST